MHQGFTVDVDPVNEGPAPISVMVNGGPVITLSVGKRGTIEFFNKNEEANVASLTNAILQVMEYGITETTQVGAFRVVTQQTIETPEGLRQFGRRSSWRTVGDQSEVTQYLPYVSP